MKVALKNTQDRDLAISQAVSPFFNKEQAAAAVQLWKEKYADQPNLSVQYFARECSQLVAETRRSQLVKNLVRELYTQLHALDHIQIRATTR